MPFVKVQKNKAYYKRIQTKYRRRRSGKTDYFARRKLVTQDCNKFNTPKFRLVARITNKRVICQIVYATIQGDRVLTQATSPELEKFGVPGGYANYAACYATGLLIARRALKIVGQDSDVKGIEGEATAEEFHIEDEDTGDKKPFKVILDVGIQRTIPGARIFAILKGAADGGLHIPHSVKKFPGFTEGDNKGDYEYDAGAHLERILGTHVGEYMEMLKEEDPDRYKQVFAKFIEADQEEDLEDMYKECHEKIRADPAFVKKANSGITNKVTGNLITTSKGTTYTRQKKISKEQKKARVQQKKMAAARKLLAATADEEEEEE